MPVDVAYPHLFSPFELAGTRLKNRIAHASISPRFDHSKGMHPSYRQYYVNRARGGAALVVTDPIAVIPFHSAGRIVAWNDSMADDITGLAQAVRREDCALLMQIQDSGRGRHVPGRTLQSIGPSPLPDDLSYTMPRPMTTDEVQQFVAAAGQSAARLQRCGVSGVEISAGHGHLFHQFLSPRSNHRADRYGGDLVGRCRFLVELCEAIRASCGNDFILGVKLPGDDGIPDSIPPATAAEIARHLTGRVRCDYLTFAQGSHHRTLEMHIPDDSTPRVTYAALFRQLRAVVPGVPVMALGRITDPAEADGILARGEAELVGIGRSLIVDPAWPSKAQAGRARDIRYCVSCNSCWKAINTGSSIRCDNNPRLAHADEVDFWPQPATARKRLVVVGAGIAGLEAAWTAAARGHAVTLLGSGDEVGGKTRLHAGLPSSESLSSIYDYQLVAARRAGVRFELGAPASAAGIAALAPDAVVLATGATMTWPACLPAELEAEQLVPDLRQAMQALLGRQRAPAQSPAARSPGAAVLLDMDQTEGTYAAAEWLRARFARVVILTPRQGIAEDVVLVMRQRILRRFFEQGIEVMTLVEPRWSASFEDDGCLEVASVFGPVVGRIEDVRFFSYATPRAPNQELVEPLAAHGIATHLIGDCKVARDVMAATSEGSAAGLTL
ncbi:MAG: FAD-dependent oxidoreductase [Lautropia sp.]